MSLTLNTTMGPITVKEMFEGYEAGIELVRGPYINKLYLCPTWAGSFAVVNALMGGGTPPTGRHICPESPNLRCMNAVLMPRAEADIRLGGRPQFNMPVVKATYQVPTWEELVQDDPQGKNSFPNEIDPGTPYVYMEQSIDWDSEIAKLPDRTYGFGDGTPSEVPFARTIGVAMFTLVRRWQDQLPFANITAYLNKLNDSTFLGQPKGQIKFTKPSTRRQMTSDGSRTQEVALGFQWREFDHNKSIRPDDGTFDILRVGGGPFGNTPYQYADLTQLLR